MLHTNRTCRSKRRRCKSTSSPGSSITDVAVTLWQSCQPAVAPPCAYQCSVVQTADLSWHRGLPGWVTGSDIRSASGRSVPALPWQLPASHTATASPWLPPHLDRTPEKWDRRGQSQWEMETLRTLDLLLSICCVSHTVNKILEKEKERQTKAFLHQMKLLGIITHLLTCSSNILPVFLQSLQYAVQGKPVCFTLCSVHSTEYNFLMLRWTNRLLITHCTSLYINETVRHSECRELYWKLSVYIDAMMISAAWRRMTCTLQGPVVHVLC